MKVREESLEVLYLEDATQGLTRKDLEELKARALKSPRKRARFCIHQGPQASLQEMIIALNAETFLPPHRHLNKVESYHIIEGRAYLVFFDESGKILQVTEMGDAASGRAFFSRAPQIIFHTFIILSDFLILHETTNGPFNSAETMPAPWAPVEKDSAAVKRFRQGLMVGIQEWLKENPT